ncbi:MAG: outer membrane protein assembly factor BamA, partial [Chromatiales bacterium]
MQARLVALLLSAALGLCATQAHAESFVIGDIEIEGLQRISAGTLFTYLPLQVGEEFETRRSGEVARALYRTGFFDDITLRRRGDILVIEVRERPSIADIRFDGNEDIETEQLEEVLKQVGIARGRVFNRSVLERLERELRQQYFARGKYNVKIETTIEELPRNRVDVSIDISEGQIARIREVTIVGNEDVDEDDLLDEMESGTVSAWKFWSSRDEYSKQKLAGDLEKIRSVYLDDGYVKFRIDSTQVSITPDKKDMYITINLEEGDRYRIKDVRLAGDLVLEEDELRKEITLEPGEIFSRKDVTETTTKLAERLGDQGYAFANVNPIPDLDEENKEVSLTLFVDPGKRVYVRRINVHGNYKTRDEVFRREFRQMEGGWYSTSKINRSKARVQRLVFVETVDVQTRQVPGADDQVDLDVTIVERQAGSFTIGAGFSQDQGVLLNLSLKEDNFLGSGKRFGIDFNNSRVNRVYSVSFTNPYATIDGVSRGINLFYREVDTDAANISRFSADRYGGILSHGIPLTEFDRTRISVGYENTKITLGNEAAVELRDFVADNGDEYDQYNFELSFSHDTRDRVIFTSKGNRQSVTLEAPAPSISDLEFYKIDFRSLWYFPLADEWILSLDGGASYADSYGTTSDLPFFEKYYAGGIRSVRGFKANTLGPRDSNNDPFGGDFRVLGSAEMFFPVPGLEEVGSFRASLFA